MPPPALNNSGTRDRFNLLLLEPREIYFKDVAVTYCSNPDADDGNKNVKMVRGRLKICSKSIVFVPQQSLNPSNPAAPLTKFPLVDCLRIEEWLPKSFRSCLANANDVISITVRSKVLMMADNRVAPFQFRKEDPAARFVFSLKYAKLDDCLPLLCQLQRASTLLPVEQNGMIATIVYSIQSRSDFDNCWLESVDERILLKTVGNKIAPLVVNPGKIVLTTAILYFQPYNNAENKPVFKVKLSSIKRVFQRRYLLRPLGLEIEFVNDRSAVDHLYLTFGKPNERKKLYHKLTIAMPPSDGDDDAAAAAANEENMTLRWQNGLVGNLEYLLYLNGAADRSFNDLTQYPVVPWVVADYTSATLDLEASSTFRDLSKPMGALNEQRLQALKERTRDMPEPKFLYGSHYSTPGFVLYFLARKIPECMLCLQNGRFDHPDRMFNSVADTWTNVTTHPSDFKELIPEFYMPQYKGDFLLNSRNVKFGVRHCGSPVHHVALPPWAVGPEDFVQKLSDAMESDHVSRNLHKWIDLIFGYKQRGKAAQQADNVFYHLCYEGSVDLDAIRDLEARHALELQIGEFGQVPKQLFTSPHPQRMASSLNTNADNVMIWPEDSDGQEDDDDHRVVTYAHRRNTTSVKDLRMVCDYKGHRERVSAVAVSADKLWILSASHDNVLKMYSLEEMALLRRISIGCGKRLTISCCHPLPNNQTVLLGSLDHTICLYGMEHARTQEFNEAHRDAVSCMDWNNDILVTGSWDGSVKVWRCPNVGGHLVEAALATLDHSSEVSAISLCPDGSGRVVVGTREGDVTLWCLKTASVIQQLPCHRRQVNGVKFGPDARRVVSCGSDFFLKVIDLKTGSILLSKNLGEELNCLTFDGRTVMVGGASGHLSIWDMHAVEFCGRVVAHQGSLTAMWVSEDGEIMATGGEDGRVVVWTTKPLLSDPDC